jgi:glutathionyl-hydroquinone reductase
MSNIIGRRPVVLDDHVQVRYSELEHGWYLFRFAKTERVREAFSAELFETLDAACGAYDTGTVTWNTLTGRRVR